MLCSVGSVWGQTQDIVFNTTQDTDGFSFDMAQGKLWYKKTVTNVGEVVVEFPLNARASDNCLAFNQGNEAYVTAPSGYVITYAKVEFCKNYTFNINFGLSGTSDQIDNQTRNYAENTYTGANRINKVRIANRASMGSSDLHVKSVTVRLHKAPTISIDAVTEYEIGKNEKLTLHSTSSGEPGVFGGWFLIDGTSATSDNPEAKNEWFIQNSSDFTFDPSEGFPLPNRTEWPKSNDLKGANTYYFGAVATQNCISGNGYEASAPKVYKVVVKDENRYTISWDATKVAEHCDAWFELAGDANKYRTTKSGVKEGTAVTYHATDGTDNNWVMNGWYKDGVPTSGEGGFFEYSKTYSENISGNLNVRPEFQNTHVYIANAGENGTAIVYAASDDNKVNISGNKYKSWEMTGGVKFEAQANPGYKFVQWNDGNTDNPRTVTEHVDGTTYTYTAQFAQSAIILNYKPQCNHYGDRENGDNYFDINCLNPGDGVTIGTADNGTGKKITVPTNGGNVKFVFNEAYNLRDLVGWTISDNADLRARVACVEFFTDENCTNRVADFWTNSGDKSGVNDSRFEGDANKIKAIRISFKNSDEAQVDGPVSYDINWMCFRFEHRDNILPVLNDGTEPEMVIRVGQTLKISNTQGYWRQYTDGTFENITMDDLIKSGFDTVCEFPNMQAGDYYFGTVDQYWCPLYGGDHGPSELVTVHVRVTDDFLVKAITEPVGLEATFTIKNNGTALSANPGYVPNTDSNATFAVSNVEGYEFDAWYLDGQRLDINVATQDAYNYGNVDKDVIAVAKFKKKYEKTDFTGYYPFINRLRAQWNFDQCDGDRLNVAALEASPNWVEDTHNYAGGNGYIEYSYNAKLNGEELKYTVNGVSHDIPISDDIKFTADANQVKFRVNYKNGEMTGANLVCASGVRMTIPYMENSCRNDRGEDYPRAVKYTQAEIDAAKAIVEADGYKKGDNTQAEETATKTTNDSYIANAAGFDNCMHHMKRDILYVALEDGKNWTWGNNDGGGYFVDRAIDRNGVMSEEKTMFYPAGEEFINGVNFFKSDFLGIPGDPCTFELRREAVFDRLAVNRNLTASYYTEYIDKMGYDTPMPGMRIRVDTQGLRVASDWRTSGYWNGAIAMTYGGWSLNGQQYKAADNSNVKDYWSENTVYSPVKVTSTNVSDVTKIPTVSDGFPVISTIVSPARSESLNPADNKSDYHPANDGKFMRGTYAENLTPWSLPCRGAYVKFEPTHPGVLNIHVVQDGGKEYFIADEFGKIDTEIPNTMTWAKPATLGNSVQRNATGGWSATNKDYVKYSFNVYPGKSYYFFSKDDNAQLGFAGFFFEPYVTRINTSDELLREDILMNDWSFTDDDSYENVNDVAWAPNEAEQVNIGGTDIPGVKSVTIYSPKKAGLDPHVEGNNFSNAEDWQPYTINYSYNSVRASYTRAGAGFQAGKWTSICLPFSMNKYQMEDQFGAGTKVVLLRDVQDKDSGIKTELTTANFIMHENQDIIAGYPYFIKPTKNTHTINANVCLYKDVPTIPEIASAGVNPNGESYGGIECFTFTGNFESKVIPAGSYVMTNDGKLTRITNNVTAKPYRAFLKFTGTDYTPATSKVIKAANYDFLADEEGMEETSVEELLFQSGIFADKANVYNVSGQMIRANADNLQGLPKGIYIVNGKKFIVK